jgi:hypothetical protein
MMLCMATLAIHSRIVRVQIKLLRNGEPAGRSINFDNQPW